MYKQGQGMLSRAGVLVLFALFGFYSGWSWYAWARVSMETMPVEMPWALLNWATLPAMVLLVGSIGGGVFVTLVNAGTADFLIDMDGELRKVIWPETQPLFDPKTEAWGATYVVIICVIVLGVFIYLVDTVFQAVIQDGILQFLYA